MAQLLRRVKFLETGGSIGPCPDMETTARHPQEDVADGRLAFLDPGEGPGVFAPPLRRLGPDSGRAFSDVRPPEFMSQPEEGFPGFAAAKRVPEGLEISRTNRGKEPILGSPRIARYARAEVTTAGGGGPRGGTSLHLEMGFIRARTAVPAAKPVRVEPSGASRWVQPVRPEHRDAGQVVTGFGGADDVIGSVVRSSHRRQVAREVERIHGPMSDTREQCQIFLRDAAEWIIARIQQDASQ